MLIKTDLFKCDLKGFVLRIFNGLWRLLNLKIFPQIELIALKSPVKFVIPF